MQMGAGAKDWELLELDVLIDSKFRNILVAKTI